MKQTVVFFTRNIRLFSRLRAALKSSVLQKAASFDGIKDAARVGASAIVLHLTDENGWILLEIEEQFPSVPVYAILAPAMSIKNSDLAELAKTSGAAGVFSSKNGVNELVAALWVRHFDLAHFGILVSKP